MNQHDQPHYYFDTLVSPCDMKQCGDVGELVVAMSSGHDPSSSLLVFLNAYRNNPQAHGITVVALHLEVFRVSYFP